MKKLFSTTVLSLICLLGLGISAHAQDASRLAVTVPFDFIAGGQTLPAGTYTVSRASQSSWVGLAIRSYDNGVFLLPVAFDDAAADQAKLAFAHVGDKYFLSEVDTPVGVYSIAMPRAMTKVAQMKDQVTLSSSGTH
jgi:hypothetical protein